MSFLLILGDAVRLFSVEVHAYALMPNHYHLLIRSPDGNLSRAMQRINACYTQQTNRDNHWDGPLFRGRFRSHLVRSEAHLAYLLAYIHLNPLRANLVTRLTSDCWTSHLAYLGLEGAPDWLSSDFFLSAFGGPKNLHEFVLNLHRGRTPWPEEMSLENGFMALADATEKPEQEEAASKPSRSTRATLDMVSKVTGASVADLRRVEYGPRANPARRFGAWVLVRRAGLTHSQAGQALGISVQQVANILRRWRRENSDEEWRRWTKEFDDLCLYDK